MLKQLHDYDPRYEMGQECHGLDNPLECSVAQLIQHQGEKYWYREEDDELKRTDNERIAYNGPKIEIPEECNEVFEPDPGASENPKIEFVILEGNRNTVHGNIGKDKYVYYRKRQDHIDLMILAQAFC